MKLIHPGAPPLQPLRYHFTKGTRTASTLVCDVSIKSDGEGDVTPALVVDLETVVEDVLGDGTAKLRFTLTRAQLRDSSGSGAASELLQAQATALQGVVVTEALAPDGTSSGAHVETTATVPDKARAQLDSLIESLEHVAVQLPADPVGIGATWEERRTLPPGGIRGVSQILYTVTALTPTSFTYVSAGRLSGGPQTIERDGMTVEVTNTSGRSEAKGKVELSRYALDVDASSVFSSTMNALVPKETPGSGASTVEIKMATRMTPIPTPTDDANDPAAGAGSAQGSAEQGSASAPGAGSAQGAHSAP